MPLSIEGRPSERAALRVLRAALDHGIELIDTADSYCRDETEMGHNERLIGRIVRKHGNSNVVVATKGGVRRPSGRWVHDGRPEYLRRACEASLGALGVDRITLYQLHAVDHRVPFEDSIGALAELRAAGLIEHIGLSNVGVEQIERALAITPIASVQNRAGFYWRAGLTDGVLDLCERKNIAFIAYAPVGGWQATRIAHEPVLQRLAATYGATPFQVVLAWLLSRSRALIPIPGASKVESVKDSAAAASIKWHGPDLLDEPAASPTRN